MPTTLIHVYSALTLIITMSSMTRRHVTPAVRTATLGQLLCGLSSFTGQREAAEQHVSGKWKLRELHCTESEQWEELGSPSQE